MIGRYSAMKSNQSLLSSLWFIYVICNYVILCTNIIISSLYKQHYNQIVQIVTIPWVPADYSFSCHVYCVQKLLLFRACVCECVHLFMLKADVSIIFEVKHVIKHT